MFVITPVYQPVITVEGEVLTSSSATSYAWFLDGQAIGGAFGMQHVATITGWYSVATVDANGCDGLSDPVWIGLLGMSDASVERPYVRPVPADDFVLVSGLRPQVEFALHATDGRIWSTHHADGNGYAVVDVSRLAPGYYAARTSAGQVLRIVVR
jgi:hypothetical protein